MSGCALMLFLAPVLFAVVALFDLDYDQTSSCVSSRHGERACFQELQDAGWCSLRDHCRQACFDTVIYETSALLYLAVVLQGPSGYLWELQELPVGELEPFREMSLIVSDITASLRYYCEVLGMRVVKSERTDDVSKV